MFWQMSAARRHPERRNNRGAAFRYSGIDGQPTNAFGRCLEQVGDAGLEAYAGS